MNQTRDHVYTKCVDPNMRTNATARMKSYEWHTRTKGPGGIRACDSSSIQGCDSRVCPARMRGRHFAAILPPFFNYYYKVYKSDEI